MEWIIFETSIPRADIVLIMIKEIMYILGFLFSFEM